MALDMNLSNQMQMAQQMKLTPAMMHSMEILQMPLAALEQRIETELNSNPVLELEGEALESSQAEEDGYLNESIDEKELDVSEDNTAESFERLESLGDDYKDYVNQDAPISAKSDTDQADPKLSAMQNTADSRMSMQAYLRDQLALTEASREVIAAAEIIIDHLNSKGYLSLSLEEISAIYEGFEYKHFEEALSLLQQFDPSGVAARDVRECLLIQLSQSCEAAPALAYEAVRDHYDKLLNNHLPQLAKALGCSMDELNEIIHYLARLDTSPGTKFVSGFENVPVRVEVIVERQNDGELSVRLANSSLPAVRINDQYAKMAHSKQTDSQTRQYLQENIRSAKWLIDAIEQRQQTLLKIATVVVRRQKEFFEKGKEYVKPLFMQEVAEQIGMHTATVSRAVSGKYIRSPQGQMPLRDLFTTSFVSEDGSVQGTEAVKEALKSIIDNEDKAKPYSDDRICELLTERGHNISRRTVVKYRKQLGLPASRMRKKFV